VTDRQAFVLLTLVAGMRSRPGESTRFAYLRGRVHEGQKVKIMHPGLAGTVEAALSDIRALAREGLVSIDHEDSMFGMIDITPAGTRAADALGHDSEG